MKEVSFGACFREGAKKSAPLRKDFSYSPSSALKEFYKGKKFFIRTFGCQANVRDEEVMAGMLSLLGMSKTDEAKEADIAIINTCAVRENAVDKVYGEIGSFKANWDKNRSFILILAGCAMEEEGFAENLLSSYPWVRLFIGTHEVPHLLEHLDAYFKEKKPLIRVRSMAGEVIESLPSLRLDGHSAFVNISYGCDKFCTYCIVPYTRGRERSRLKEDVLKECEQLVKEGYKEITLLGQNVNSYGLDFGETDAFPDLLSSVAELGIPRLRFITSYPSQFTDKMISAMAEHPNVLPWLHFPVQSGSNAVLRKMGRRYTREEYLSLVDKLYAKIPHLAITTDIIVGFPGESEEDFEETLSLCKKARFSSAFTFIYSPRPGTPAAKWEQIPSEVSHKRFDRLKEVIDECTAAHSSSMVGKTYSVLVTGTSKKNENRLSGYATNGKLINFEGPSYLKGCIADVKVTESHVYSLLGELTEDPLISKAKDIAYLLEKEPILNEYRRLALAVKEDVTLQKALKDLPYLKKNLALSMDDEKKHQEALKAYQEVEKIVESSLLLKNLDAMKDSYEGELSLIASIVGSEK